MGFVMQSVDPSYYRQSYESKQVDYAQTMGINPHEIPLIVYFFSIFILNSCIVTLANL